MPVPNSLFALIVVRDTFWEAVAPAGAPSLFWLLVVVVVG
jgi:hypothetical protein